MRCFFRRILLTFVLVSARKSFSGSAESMCLILKRRRTEYRGLSNQSQSLLTSRMATLELQASHFLQTIGELFAADEKVFFVGRIFSESEVSSATCFQRNT
jgi:hypothetical protein